MINKLLIYACVLLFMSSCSSGNGDKTRNLTSITFGELGDIEQLDDSSFPLKNGLDAYERVDDSRVIISDQKPGIYLLNENTITLQYGRIGNGPCEYQEITDLHTSGGKLYVMEVTPAKIITYDIASGKCLDEFSSELLNDFSSIHKMEDENAFLIGNRSYNGVMADTTSLLREINEDGQIKDLGLTLGEINPVRSPYPMEGYPKERFKVYGDKLYAYFPLGDNIWIYDLQTGSLRLLSLGLDLKREKLEELSEAKNNQLEVMRILNSGFTTVWRLFVEKDWVAISTIRRDPDENRGVKLLKIYSHQGEFLGEVEYDHDIVAYQNGEILQLIKSTDPAAEFAYSLGRRELVIK